MIQIETKDAMKGLQSLTRKLSLAEVKKAQSRAINHTLQIARTTTARAIREVYKIPYADARGATRIVRASQSTPTGYLKASGSRTPLSAFNPRMLNEMGSFTQLKRGALVTSGKAKKSLRIGDRRRIGVMEVEIKVGRKERVNSAFFLPTLGKSTIMARGTYDSSKAFAWRHKRIKKSGNDTPIAALDTVSVYKAATTPETQTKIFSAIGSRYVDRLVHELSRAMEGQNT